ncbi:MAG: hypothetical protein A2079_08380 [Geobacteraceae bacterium GWC2_48_7]|nr:MAG: hypothetical protein A2079_08380 [Geobacteraceae bacterium GWC2_48_7]
MQYSGQANHKYKILIVEDDKPTRDLLEAIISRKYPEIKLLTAGNGREGLDVFQKQQPEIVFTDISMPLMDGIEMAGEMKKIKPETIFVVLTAFNNRSFLSKFNEIGYSTYVTKPIEFNKLFEALNKCITEAVSVSR